MDRTATAFQTRLESDASTGFTFSAGESIHDQQDVYSGDEEEPNAMDIELADRSRRGTQPNSIAQSYLSHMRESPSDRGHEP